MTCEDLAADSDFVDFPRASLVDQSQWQKQDPAQDPLASHISDDYACVPNPFYVEQGDLEFNTGFCTYLSIEQPSQLDIAQGAPVEVGIFHFDLTAPEPAQAHVAVLFDGEVQWEQMIDIPGPADVIEACFSAQRALSKGELLSVHIHNHGQNTWSLTHIQTIAP